VKLGVPQWNLFGGSVSPMEVTESSKLLDLTMYTLASPISALSKDVKLEQRRVIRQVTDRRRREMHARRTAQGIPDSKPLSLDDQCWSIEDKVPQKDVEAFLAEVDAPYVAEVKQVYPQPFLCQLLQL
jgi:hypothetical protein